MVRVLSRLRAWARWHRRGRIEGVPAEFLRLHFKHWRTSLLGAATANWVTAGAFSSFAGNTRLWAWAALGTLIYVAEAALCLSLERKPAQKGIPRVWHDAVTILSFGVGLTWGSLPWWLPGSNTGIQLALALVGTFVITGASSASGSRAVLLAIVVTTSMLLSIGLTWHAGMPRVALLALAMNAVTLRYGLTLQRAMFSVLEERHRAENLSRQLATEQAKLRAVAMEHAVLEERHRLMRDMHDGIGSSMISALKMFEHGRIDLKEAASVMRECVDELRIVIDSLEPLEGDLGALLGTLRHRMGARLQRVGVSVDWFIDDLPPLPWLAASQALDVLRIVQEMLANVVHHADARRVRASTRILEAPGIGQGIDVLVEDDGVGFDPDRVDTGRGLRHMRERARRLGGDVIVESGPGRGTRVHLLLPIA